ncbi:MAG: hypothetical protein AAGD33_05635 [Actinomycetota bacterium]
MTMNRLIAFAAAASAIAACSSSFTEGDAPSTTAEAADALPTPTPDTSTSTAPPHAAVDLDEQPDGGFQRVETIDAVAGAWVPVALDGEPASYDRGEFWEVSGTDLTVRIEGWDGCNEFATATGDDGLAAMLTDGVLAGGSQRGVDEACDNQLPSPIGPLALWNHTIRDELIVVFSDPDTSTVRFTEADRPPSNFRRDTAPETVAPLDGLQAVETIAAVTGRWEPIEIDGLPVDAALGASLTIAGSDDDLVVLGDDGCNEFGTYGIFDDRGISFVDGRLLDVLVTTDEAECGPHLSVDIVPDDGTSLWIDESTGDLVTAPVDRSVEWVRFTRADDS